MVLEVTCLLSRNNVTEVASVFQGMCVCVCVCINILSLNGLDSLYISKKPLVVTFLHHFNECFENESLFF